MSATRAQSCEARNCTRNVPAERGYKKNIHTCRLRFPICDTCRQGKQQIYDIRGSRRGQVVDLQNLSPLFSNFWTYIQSDQSYFISRSMPDDGAPLLDNVPALASSSSLSFSFLALMTSQSTDTYVYTLSIVSFLYITKKSEIDAVLLYIHASKACLVLTSVPKLFGVFCVSSRLSLSLPPRTMRDQPARFSLRADFSSPPPFLTVLVVDALRWRAWANNRVHGKKTKDALSPTSISNGVFREGAMPFNLSSLHVSSNEFIRIKLKLV